MRPHSLWLVLVLLSASFSQTQDPESVRIQVHADQPDGRLAPIWSYFGYDEPNYTYAPNGKKLLRELAALSPTPVYVRTHNLLTTGDGSSSLKWGSTNAYTEDAAGNPVYSWTIVDRIFDTFRETGVKPLVEIGFMPEALSTQPEPYRHSFPQGPVFTGWTYPPKDYGKWGELVFQFVHHLRERYGDAEVETWLWEVWNEPDIPYWKGTPEEYFKLYDYAADATLRALPGARIGGPHSTAPGPGSKAADFLRSFLEHCAHGKNYATGKAGAPLYYIGFHAKGSPKWQRDHVQMGIATHLAAIENGFKIVKSFPEFGRTPIVIGESDPEGCAACSAKTNPANGYRNGPLYGAYTVEVFNNIQELVQREQVNFLGAVTWAFEFEDQPYFEGFRSLASGGIDKPVLNAFRMLGLLGENRVKASSSASLPSAEVVSAGVRGKPDINAIASRKANEVTVLVWNYHDEEVVAVPAPVELTIEGIPASVHHGLVEHFRVDATRSNAFAAWKEMGQPQSPSPSQYEALEKAGQLQMLASPAWTRIIGGKVQLRFTLPRQALSLVRISW